MGLDSDAAAERATVAGLNVAANRFEIGYATLGMRAAALIRLADEIVLVPRVPRRGSTPSTM